MKTTFLLGTTSLLAASACLWPPGSGMCSQRQWPSVKHILYSSVIGKSQRISNINIKSISKEQTWLWNSYLSLKLHFCRGTARVSAAFPYPVVFLGTARTLYIRIKPCKMPEEPVGVCPLQTIFQWHSHIQVCKPRPVKMVWGPGKDIFRIANKLKS